VVLHGVANAVFVVRSVAAAARLSKAVAGTWLRRVQGAHRRHLLASPAEKNNPDNRTERTELMKRTTATSTGPLDHTFQARLVQAPGKGGWTYVVMDGSGDFFGTRGLVKVRGTIDGQPFTSSFMALGDGTHKLPVKAAIRVHLNKGVGDSVTVHLEQRLPRR
jgi:Domain of unknown function (DUF1905)